MSEKKKEDGSKNSKGESVRNICIMAHVDHGKTTLADALIASNGIISESQAGSIRYMDSRPDEMERGITMKSSCITLVYPRRDQQYLVNLVDSPGHVDFSSEVSTAVRLCDGCVLVVDVVEGVCAQTKAVMRQAWAASVKPVLVLNKLDRLIVEKEMTPLDAYYHTAHVLQQVNAYMGELHNTDVLGRTNQAERTTKPTAGATGSPRKSISEDAQHFSDWAIEDVDDSDLYFNPTAGNVVFASAIDGWGFSIGEFARQFSERLGMSYRALSETLWGDYYISSKGGEKRILRGARDKRKNPLFVSLILDNLYMLYRKVRPATAALEDVQKIVQGLGLKLPHQMCGSSTDTKARFTYICSSWLPLSASVLGMVVDELPPPTGLSEERAKKLLTTATHDYSALPAHTRDLLPHLLRCAADGPLVVYVSKMFGVSRQKLLQAQQNLESKQAKASGSTAPRTKTAQQKEETRQKTAVQQETTDTQQETAEQQETTEQHKTTDTQQETTDTQQETTDTQQETTDTQQEPTDTQQEPTDTQHKTTDTQHKTTDTQHKTTDTQHTTTSSTVATDDRGSPPPAFEDDDPEVEELLAFARVFSGSLKPGQEVYVLGPKHDPSTVVPLLTADGELTSDDLQRCPYVTKCRVGSVYLLMGREVKALSAAGAGLMVGIAGLTQHIIKSGSLSSVPTCPPFTHVIDTHTAAGGRGAGVGDPTGPILRVPVLPQDPRCLGKLRDGLKLLNQADPCVQVWLEKSGEYMIGAAGEVHLQRCLTDLRDRYARTAVVASDPIVPFRETVVARPLGDKTSEPSQGTNGDNNKQEGDGSVLSSSAAGSIRVRALPLPAAVTDLLLANTGLLRTLSAHTGDPHMQGEGVNAPGGVEKSPDGVGNSPDCVGGVDSISNFSRLGLDSVNNTSKDGLGQEQNSSNNVNLSTNTSSRNIDQEDSSSNNISNIINTSSNDEEYINSSSSKIGEETKAAALALQREISEAFEAAGEEWAGAGEQLWSVGPHYCGPNVLLNRVPEYKRPSLWHTNAPLPVDSPLSAMDHGFITGFQLCSAAGTLCEEPLMGVCFVVEEWRPPAFGDALTPGKVMAVSKELLLSALEEQPRRMMVATYSCVVSVTTEVVGRVYSVLGKRHGRILRGDITEGSTSWNVTAYLPIVESIDFANELRKATSGEAQPMLMFSHWETLDIDPYWDPSTAEELEHFGEKADTENLARHYMNNIRRRKGIKEYGKKLVEFGEKQRTLTKNK